MPYSASNPPTLRHQDVGNQGPSEWAYSNTDAPSVVRVNNFISNARALGMKQGDVVRYRQDGTTPQVIHTFIVSAINANGAANLSDGTALTATNTD